MPAREDKVERGRVSPQPVAARLKRHLLTLGRRHWPHGSSFCARRVTRPPGAEVSLNQKKIKAYFTRQLHLMMGPSGNGSEAFRTYFASWEPKDEAILGLLAVSAIANGKFPAGHGFSALVEALAALSPATRAKLCRKFRRELKNLRRQMAPP